MTVSILLSNFNIQYLLLPLTCLFSHSTKFVCLAYNTLCHFCLFIYSLSSPTCIYIKSYHLFHYYALMKTPACLLV